MVVDRGMDGDELLQTSRSAEAPHGPFSSSKRQVRILGAIVQPATCFLSVSIADDLHRGTVNDGIAGLSRRRSVNPSKVQYPVAVPMI